MRRTHSQRCLSCLLMFVLIVCARAVSGEDKKTTQEAKEKKPASAEPSGKHSIRVKLGYHVYTGNPIPSEFQTNFFSVRAPFPTVSTSDEGSSLSSGFVLPGASVIRKGDFNALSGEVEYDFRLNPGFSLGVQFGTHTLGNARSSGTASGLFPRTDTSSLALTTTVTPSPSSSSSSFCFTSTATADCTTAATNFITTTTSTTTPTGSTVITFTSSNQVNHKFQRALSASAQQRVTYITFSPKAHLIDILRGTKKGAALSRFDVYVGPVVGFYRGDSTVNGAADITDAFTQTFTFKSDANTNITSTTVANSTSTSNTPTSPFITKSVTSTDTNTVSTLVQDILTTSRTDASGNIIFPTVQLRVADKGNSLGVGAVLGLEFLITKHFGVFVEDRYVHVQKLLFDGVFATRITDGDFVLKQTSLTKTTTSNTSASTSNSTSTTTTTTTFAPATGLAPTTSTSSSSSAFASSSSSATSFSTPATVNQQISINKVESFLVRSNSLADWGGNTVQFGVSFRW